MVFTSSKCHCAITNHITVVTRQHWEVCCGLFVILVLVVSVFVIVKTSMLVLVLISLLADLWHIYQSVVSNILLSWDDLKFLNTKQHLPHLIKVSWTKSLPRVVIPAQLKSGSMKDGTCGLFPSSCCLYNHTVSRPDSKCSIICHEEISPNGKALVATDY